MSPFSHVPTALSRSDSETNVGDKVAALPTVTTPNADFKFADLEACGTDSEITVQEPSVTKRASLDFSEPRTLMRHFWQGASGLVLPITKLWRKPEPDPFWKELPEKIKYEKIQDYSEGIPQLAAFINSDDSFCIWRTFGQLHSRILLQKLLELNCLETELQQLDCEDDLAPETRYRLQIGQHCNGWDMTQKNLVDKIAGKLSDYDDLMLKHHALKSIPKPSKSNYESILNYIWKKRPLYEGHFDFVFRIQDFVRLGLRPQNEQFHDRLLRWISHWSESPLNLFRDPKRHQDDTAQYYLSHRLNFIIKSFITFLIISILMVPILLLYLIPMEKSIMVVVVLISLFIFSVSLSLFRDSKPQDMFFGTATYCAVILVFLAGQTNVVNVASGT